MDYYDGGWGVGEWVGMGLLMLLFWGGLAALLVWAVRTFSARPGTPPPASGQAAPLQVLAERFARGEIDADEFQRARELLTTPAPHARQKTSSS